MSTAHFQKLPQAYKFVIGNIPERGDEGVTVEAQFNPKDLQIDSPIGWAPHEAIGAKTVAAKPMEFTGMGVETMKVELVFDAYENNSDHVVNAIKALKQMASVPQADARNPKGKHQRPNFCVATWGTQEPFRCVIESIGVKYTMFSFEGTPVRATVILGLKSGRRTVDNDGENKFEKASRERLESQRKKLGEERKVHQENQENERARRDAEALREQRKRDYQLE